MRERDAPGEPQALVVDLGVDRIGLEQLRSAKDPPPTADPPTDPLPRAMKGYEVYSWQVGKEWYFTLITGTKRIKTVQEITADANDVQEDRVKITLRGVHDLEAALDQLPPDTVVTWMGRRTLRQIGVKPGELALPPGRVVREVRSHCAEAGIQLEVSR